MDKIMEAELMYISNYDFKNYSFCRFKSFIEKFGHLRNLQTNLKFEYKFYIN